MGSRQSEVLQRFIYSTGIVIKLTLAVYSNIYAKLILIRILPAYVKSQFTWNLWRFVRSVNNDDTGQKLDTRHTMQPVFFTHKLRDSAVYEATRLSAAEFAHLIQ